MLICNETGAVRNFLSLLPPKYITGTIEITIELSLQNTYDNITEVQKYYKFLFERIHILELSTSSGTAASAAGT